MRRSCDAWLECMRTAVRDVHRYVGRAITASRIINADARSVEDILETGFRRLCDYFPAVSQREGLHENDTPGIRGSWPYRKSTRTS